MGQGRSDASVVTCVVSLTEKIILLSIYDKSEKENITPKQLKTMLKEVFDEK